MTFPFEGEPPLPLDDWQGYDPDEFEDSDEED